jgi:hypothetical protein
MADDEIEKQSDDKEPSDMNPDALEAALGDDYVEIDEEVVIYSYTSDDEEDLDIAFTDADPRDWY